jgi:aminopeptidase
VIDLRYERLGELVAAHSLEVREGDLLRIDSPPAGAPLVTGLYRAALRHGANVYVNTQLPGVVELLLELGAEEQLEYISPIQQREIELMDALVTVWSDANTRALSGADPERHRRYIASRRALTTRYWERIGAGDARWCGTLCPTHGHAQDAEMSLAEYEDFVFGACHVLEGENPVAHWRATSEKLGARAQELASVRELRIVGPDTDLKLVVDGRTWIPADGKFNLPDGEVFTSPVEEGTEGEIRFGFPAIFHGRAVDDVRLRFESGKVVAADAARGRDYLEALLDMDAEARFLGECAFGLNYEIDRFTRNILFDEKIGGTIHVALGAGFPQAGGKNRSGLHWDLICDLREEGEVYADGELVWKVGSFLREAEPAVEHV